MEAVFLSDLHLNSLEERNGQTLLRFFHSLEALSDPLPAIFLLGDIFDLWVSDHQVFLDRYRPLLESLERLHKRGARVVYFEGNHDLHLAPYWSDKLGAEIYVHPGMFEVGGLRIRCEHGDEINREDLAYLRLRAFLRHPLFETFTHKVSGKLLDQVGQKWSKHSRKKSSGPRPERDESIRKLIRTHAEKMWEEDPFDVIISGHMHVRDDWSFERAGKKIRAINLGSWFDEPKVLVLEKGQLEWRSP